ncbi:MAG: transglutaminaseTgpA domain-containing protein, partial [Pseudomonadales bacterium]
MSVVFQIPRNCLAILLFAQAAVLLPHLTRLPIWVTTVCVVCAMWRILLFTGRGFYPGSLLKFLLVAIAFIGIWNSYGTLVSLEAVVALLITAFALKLIEMKHRRDVFAVIFLAYFVAAMEFLFEQNILLVLYMFFAVALVTAALIAMHESDERQRPTHALFTGAKLMGQALPLAIVLFIVFPRFGPLWAVPSQQSKATTGQSDSMAPGDFAELAKSNELAFRVKFEGEQPTVQSLYWRGLVFSYFDGRRWNAQQPEAASSQWQPYRRAAQTTGVNAKKRGKPIDYAVTLEANQQPWLYALSLAESDTLDVVETGDFRLLATRPIDQRFLYNARSHMNSVLEPELTRPRRLAELQLPEVGDPLSREFAGKLRQQSGTDAEYVQAVLQHFNQNEFVYTLRPGKLGRDTIDEFLFSSRRGFCEHYASSFVFLMRAADVPARVVVGYQGGEINPYEDYLLVHQFDAHAWTEVWLAGRGWQRVDPTSAVAPNRIELGIGDTLGEELRESGPLSLSNFRHIELLNWARLRWDGLNYSWTQLVLNYDAAAQVSFFEEWLGAVSPLRIALFLLGSGALVLSLVAISLMRDKVAHKLHPIDAIYLRHCKALDRIGLR